MQKYDDVYDLISSESVSRTKNPGKNSKEKVDNYLGDIVSIIENDNPISTWDIKLLANAARSELKNI